MKNLDQIIKRCNDGNEAACKQLYNEFLPYCYGICRRYQVSESDIKDQIQIIFSASFKSLNRFDSTKASFKTWFTRVAINKIVEEKRKHYRTPVLEELTDYDLDASSNDEAVIDDNLDRAYILSILNQMPRKYQDVFNMNIIDGYSHNEISGILGISVGASRVILSRSREWAKKALESYLKHS